MNRKLTDSEEKYVTLFCEGDGALYVNETSSGRYPRITFSQTEKHVLEYLHTLLGLLSCISPSGNGSWSLQINGHKCIPLLETFSRHTVSNQFLKRLNILNTLCKLPSATQHPIDIDGLAGFWDAEGSSAYQNALHLEIPQKDREILDIIADNFGGSVGHYENAYHWQLTGKKAEELAPKIIKRSHCPTKRERLRANLFPTAERKKAMQTKRHESYLQRKALIQSYKEMHGEQ